jgi:serine protease Do
MATTRPRTHTAALTPAACAPRRSNGRLRRIAPVLAGVCLLAVPSAARAGTPQASATALRAFNASVEELTRRVSASVVQVLVTGYGPVDNQPRGNTSLLLGLQHSLGSGAVIDADGYIVTNAHVVAGAKRVQVVLHDDDPEATGFSSLRADSGRTVEARVVGTAGDIDLALLKVEATNLHPIPLADYTALRQGEVVFAFGSPEGLRNSVTMGVVSSVARQPDPDRPSIYVQTDAPINRGNSGGPLVNVEGELVGLNTFILSDSGGSQGLGFAIPSAVVASAYPQLRKFGHLHRGMVGINLQTITPTLARGLGLSREAGVMVSDVLPDGPADTAGVEVTDIVAAVNGTPVENVPMLSLQLGMMAAGDHARLDLLRGHDPVSVDIVVADRPRPLDQLAELADPVKNALPSLGIIGVDVTDATRPMLPSLRMASGVFVAARTQPASGAQVPLETGDVIHALNTYPVRSLDGLRVLLDRSALHDFVLQVERDGALLFVACDAE